MQLCDLCHALHGRGTGQTLTVLRNILGSEGSFCAEEAERAVGLSGAGPGAETDPSFRPSAPSCSGSITESSCVALRAADKTWT